MAQKTLPRLEINGLEKTIRLREKDEKSAEWDFHDADTGAVWNFRPNGAGKVHANWNHHRRAYSRCGTGAMEWPVSTRDSFRRILGYARSSKVFTRITPDANFWLTWRL